MGDDDLIESAQLSEVRRTGPDYAIQGNILVSEATVDAMEKAFLSTKGSLADRLLQAIKAGAEAGGDRRRVHRHLGLRRERSDRRDLPALRPAEDPLREERPERRDFDRGSGRSLSAEA